MARLFFSYSHVDEGLRDQLEVHLSLLKRQGLIEAWHDRRITVGSEFDAAINKNLEDANVILLLVSADFLASDYCFSRELTRALERHNARQARVIPVILRPCDWHGAPFGRLLAAPHDGKPVTTWANQDEAFTDVARKIREAVEEVHRTMGGQTATGRAGTEVGVASGSATPARAVASAAEAAPRSSNLRVKKEFSDLDKDRFLHDSFEFMARFFEASLQELATRNPGVEGRLQRVDAGRFAAVIYRDGKAVAECSIGLDGYGSRSEGIAFSHGATAHGGSFNEMLSVEADTQKLYFKPLGMAFHGGAKEGQLSQQGASEYFWELLIRPLQD